MSCPPKIHAMPVIINYWYPQSTACRSLIAFVFFFFSSIVDAVMRKSHLTFPFVPTTVKLLSWDVRLEVWPSWSVLGMSLVDTWIFAIIMTSFAVSFIDEEFLTGSYRSLVLKILLFQLLCFFLMIGSLHPPFFRFSKLTSTMSHSAFSILF